MLLQSVNNPRAQTTQHVQADMQSAGAGEFLGAGQDRYLETILCTDLHKVPMNKTASFRKGGSIFPFTPRPENSPTLIAKSAEQFWPQIDHKWLHAATGNISEKCRNLTLNLFSD